jgi:hypothetical protein
MYLDVLNQHHWIETAQATNLSFSDTGVFYLHAAAPPARTRPRRRRNGC